MAGTCEIQVTLDWLLLFCREQSGDAVAQGPDLLLAATINPFYVLSPVSCCVLQLCVVKIQCCWERLFDKSGKDVNN